MPAWAVCSPEVAICSMLVSDINWISRSADLAEHSAGTAGLKVVSTDAQPPSP
jgi:hypothetical protein